MNENFGKLNEKKLHNDLKNYITEDLSLHEKKIDGFLVDVVKDQTLFEVQTGNFSNIKSKLNNLLDSHKVRVVHNIPVLKIIKKIDTQGNILSIRKSPKKGKIHDAAKELIYIADAIKRDNFSFEIVLTKEEEVRVDDKNGSWRRKGVSIRERNLIEILESKLFLNRNDYLIFIPEGFRNPEKYFSSNDIKKELSTTLSVSRKILYFLKKIGLVESVDKKGNLIIYKTACHV